MNNLVSGDINQDPLPSPLRSNIEKQGDNLSFHRKKCQIKSAAISSDPS
jgi:hypothetical protein